MLDQSPPLIASLRLRCTVAGSGFSAIHALLSRSSHCIPLPRLVDTQDAQVIDELCACGHDSTSRVGHKPSRQYSAEPSICNPTIETTVDNENDLVQDLYMAGRVETAVRATVPLHTPLRTPSGRGRFTVARYTTEGLVLLLGDKEAWTPLPWKALEELPDFLRGRGQVRIGGVYSMDSDAGTLDGHLKQYLARATAGWVASVVEKAGVVDIDRTRPATVQLKDHW